MKHGGFVQVMKKPAEATKRLYILFIFTSSKGKTNIMNKRVVHIGSKT